VKLGIGTYCYMWSLGVEGAFPRKPMHPLELLDEAIRLGLSVVQYGPNRPLSDDEAAQIGQFARQRGILLERGTTGLDPVHIAREAVRCRQ